MIEWVDPGLAMKQERKPMAKQISGRILKENIRPENLDKIIFFYPKETRKRIFYGSKNEKNEK